VVSKNIVIQWDGGRRIVGAGNGGGRALWHGGMWGGNANQISMRREMLEMPWKHVGRRPGMPPTKHPVCCPPLEVRELAVGGASAAGRGTAACVSRSGSQSPADMPLTCLCS